MNINQFTLKHVNVEQPLMNVKAGEGTYNEICEKTYDGTIYPLTDNAGNVVGLGYETGLTGAEDSIELRKFEKRYRGKPVMEYFERALKAKYEGKSLEEALTLYEEKAHNSDIKTETEEDLPNEVTIRKEDINNNCSDNNIKSYLRRTYGHYLSRYCGDIEVESIDDNTVKVSGIRWGRKI